MKKPVLQDFSQQNRLSNTFEVISFIFDMVKVPKNSAFKISSVL